MLDRVQRLPNEPQQFVALIRHLSATHPATLKAVRVNSRYFGVSARLVRADATSEAEAAAPITWRFVRGFASQDDQGLPGRDDVWGMDVDVPAHESDARPRLEAELGGGEFEWFVWKT